MMKKTPTKGRKKETGSQEALTLKAYNGIRRKLFFNEISPGQKIYYSDLAEEMKMSPTPVIQALKWLEFQGLVRHENNRGFFLEPVSLNEIKEIYRLRRTIEVDLLRQSFEHLTDGDIKKIEKVLGHYEETHRSDYHKKQFMAAREFHLTLASFAQAPITYTTLHRLFDLIYLKYQVDTLFSRASEQAMTSHRKIFECIKARDCEGACACLTADIDNVSRRVVDNMMKNLAEKEKFQI
ncbi:MAG: GntR family transcriptional regulator [Deltaproteobacteria bacterium]|nr:GntR family transcriptional regulator [Deltaproteobacteria bacterium]